MKRIYEKISPEMTFKTGQLSVRPCVRAVSIWAEVEWSMKLACIFYGSWNKTSRKRNFEFRPLAPGGVGEMTHPTGVLIISTAEIKSRRFHFFSQQLRRYTLKTEGQSLFVR